MGWGSTPWDLWGVTATVTATATLLGGDKEGTLGSITPQRHFWGVWIPPPAPLGHPQVRISTGDPPQQSWAPSLGWGGGIRAPEIKTWAGD